MDFLKQVAEFQHYIEQKHLSCGQIALYYALLNIANSSSEEWFSICDTILQLRCGLSRQGLIKAKNSLKQFGLIDFTKGKGRQTPKYTIIEDSVHLSVQNSVHFSVHLSEEEDVSSKERVRADACENSNIYNNKINNNTSTTTEESEYSGIENGTIPQSATLTAPFTQGSLLERTARETALGRCTREPLSSGSGKLKCISAYEQNIGVITPRAAEIFIEYINAGLEDELICLCIDEAVRANVRNLNYIDKIIFNCQAEGIKTAAAFKARTERKRTGNTGYSNNGVRPSLGGTNIGSDPRHGGWEGVKEL